MNPLYRSNKRPLPLYCFSLILLLIPLNSRAINTNSIPVLQESPWAPVQTIPLYDPETWPPILIADQNHTVHAFSYQWVRNPGTSPVRGIVYNTWTMERGWTNPVDILMSPEKEARLTDVKLDKKGYFNLVFFGGDNTSANIYYSKAPAVDAGDANAWSAPVIVGPNAGDPEGAALTIDDQGALYVVFSGRQLGNGVYVINSMDGGETWSLPSPIFFTREEAPHVSELQSIRGKSGWLHSIWAVNSIEGQGRGIYYVRSKDGNAWSEPVLLARAEDGLGTQVPTIYEYKDILFAEYVVPVNGSNKIVIRQSRDDGATWSDQAMIFPRHQGVNGLVSFVTDSNGGLHLFFGQRIQTLGAATVHGMWHSVFLNNRWTEPEGIIKGFKTLDKEGNTSFDPNTARAVVSQGNVILITWRTDPGSKGNGVWYSYKEIDAPELLVVPLPTHSGTIINPIFSPGPTSVDEDLSVTPAPTGSLVNSGLFEISNSSSNPGRIFGGVAVAVVCFLAVILFLSRKR